MTTPAQAAGHQSFKDSFGPGGPTDAGMRKAGCDFMQTHTLRPACADCEGPIPMWTRTTGVGEQISYGGFSLSAAGDPEVWTRLTYLQQTWVMNTLTKLNDLIVKSTGTSCPTWGPSITAAGGCFQNWFNANNPGLTRPDGSKIVLRTDGVFDQETLDALRTIAGMNPKDFPTPFPGTEAKKLSTGAMVGIAAGGAAVLGGIAYLATRKKSRRRR